MDNAKSMVLASFIGDAVSMGVHWIYDTDALNKDYGHVDTYVKPAPDSYHPTKDVGDLTHLADQSFILLQSLADRGAFDLDDFSTRWHSTFKSYDGYIDHATRVTLAGYSEGKDVHTAGSESLELAGASRAAPLIYRYRDDLDELVMQVRSQTAMTHNNPVTVDVAEFFAQTAKLVLDGAGPVEAMKAVARLDFETSQIADWVRLGLESKDIETLKAIAGFGQQCAIEGAFPSSVHAIARYENDLKEALIQNVNAGGDNAARGLAIGLVLGAHLGTAGLPEDWVAGLNKKDAIIELLDKIDKKML